MFTQYTLLIFDVVLLVLGPLVVLILHHPKAVQVSWWLDLLIEFIGLGWMISCWTWGKFWIAVVEGFLLQAVLVTTFLKTNKYASPTSILEFLFKFDSPSVQVFHAHPYAVLTSLLSLAYLSTIAILNIINPQSPTQQRHILLIQIYVFTWALHLLATILVAKWHVGGFYFFTAWNFSMFLANICDSCERAFTQPSLECSPGLSDLARTAAENQPTERTPLLAPDGAANPPQESGSAKVKVLGSGWWFIMQLLLFSVPVMLMSHLLVLVVDALGQTFTDGSNPVMGRYNLFGAIYSADSSLVVSIRRCSISIVPHYPSNSAIYSQNPPLGDLCHPPCIYCIYCHNMDYLPIFTRCAPHGVFPTTGYAGCCETRQPDYSCRHRRKWCARVHRTCCGIAAPLLVGFDY